MTKQTSRFAKGIKLKKQDFKNGNTGETFTIYKMGINKDDFLENPFNKHGWANFEIRFAKGSGEPYAVIDTFYNDYHDSKPEENEEILF